MRSIDYLTEFITWFVKQEEFELDFESIKVVLSEYFKLNPKFALLFKDSGKDTINEIINEIILDQLDLNSDIKTQDLQHSTTEHFFNKMEEIKSWAIWLED